jgi:hypothetical protein
MYKRARVKKTGGLVAPRPKRCSSLDNNSIAGSKRNKFQKSTEEHEALVEAKLKELMVTMKIKATNNNLTPRRTGGIPLTNNTILSYEKHYESLYFFFLQIQDYESLLMLRREPLEYFP